MIMISFAFRLLFEHASAYSNENHGRFGVILRNIIKLLIAPSGIEIENSQNIPRVCKLLNFGIAKTRELGTKVVYDSNIEEIKFFFGISWNLA